MELFLYTSIVLSILGIVLLVHGLVRRAEPGVHDAYHAVDREDRSGPGERTHNQARDEYYQSGETVAIAPPPVAVMCEEVRDEGDSGVDGALIADENDKPAEMAEETGTKRVESSPPGDAASGRAESPVPEPRRGTAGSGSMAVLFNDGAGLVEMDGTVRIIDPTLEKYRDLRRVGSGLIDIVKDGINFTIEKNLYRFDYQKIENMRLGENYAAIFLRNSPSVRLFIFEKNDPFPGTMYQSFRDFYSQVR